ncbi:MAG: amidohydrolase family protein, partial [Planctomycetota bacterium]|nr:amidohydrolase family protein [Planctomycetota bacterium]
PPARTCSRRRALMVASSSGAARDAGGPGPTAPGGGVPEGTLSITADVDISDVIEPTDISIYRALAGGVTTIQCLHGSANAIGGRSEVLKLRWGATADELRFPDAPQGIKFALGENPKQSNWNNSDSRFPGSRPGVEAVFERGFDRAADYADQWRSYYTAVAGGEDPVPPRRDLRLEVLSQILAGTVKVHSHSYRADEILMLLRVAERHGFRVQTLQHVLEGYKIAAEIAEHGAGPSTFADWWGYKIEAYDAIPQNAALLDEAGAVSTINSDSDELMRHLYHEASKSIKYAGLDPVAALRLCTLNGAIQLGLGDRTGSIETGKDADLVLLSGDPMSVYSKVLLTLVDGEVEFERMDLFALEDAVVGPRDYPIEAHPVPDLPTGEGAGAGMVAIVGGTVHPIDAPPIEQGTVLIQDGRILAVGTGIAVPEGAVVHDAFGKHVWPGMIALNTPVGLFEIGSVAGTNDMREGGGNQPDLSVASSIHPDSAHITVTRTNGITRSQSAPRSRGPLRGQSAVIDLDGQTWEELVTVERDMLHLGFPRQRYNEKAPKEEPEAIADLRELFAEAREWHALDAAAREFGGRGPGLDHHLRALAPYALGEKRIALHADGAQTILAAMKFAKDEGLDAVLYGCTDGWKIAPRIAEEGFTVVVGPVLSLPGSEFEPYDARYANAAVLARAGVPVAIQSRDDENSRNLPFHAGFASAFGLPRTEAYRAVTLGAAEVLGLESELGSLTPGKRADVIVTNGDLLDGTTAVEAIWIDGQGVDTGNRQTELYERYRERLHRVQGK